MAQVSIFNVGAIVKFSVLDTSVRVYSKVFSTTVTVDSTAMTCAQATARLITASPRLILASLPHLPLLVCFASQINF